MTHQDEFKQKAMGFYMDRMRNPERHYNDEYITPHEKQQLIWAKEAIESQKPVLDDLQENGYDIKNLEEIQYYKELADDPKLYELIWKWLLVTEDKSVRSTLVDSLAPNKQIKKHPEAIQYLLDEWAKLGPDGWSTRDSIAQIVANNADDRFYDQVLAYAKNTPGIDLGDESHVVPRAAFVEALANMKQHPEVVDELIDILEHDPLVLIQTIETLGKLKNPKALPYLRPYMDDKRSWIRSEAKKAVAKIEKAQGI
jgi:HEAT repeat protein